MKTFLSLIVAVLITYVLAPFVFLAITSWFWLPMVFSINDLSTLLGFIIGLFVSSGTAFVYHKLVGSN